VCPDGKEVRVKAIASVEDDANHQVSPESELCVATNSSLLSQSFSALGSNLDDALGFVSTTLMLRDADRFRDHVCEVNYSRQGTAEQRAKDLERRLEDGNFPLRSCFFDTDMYFQDLGEHIRNNPDCLLTKQNGALVVAGQMNGKKCQLHPKLSIDHPLLRPIRDALAPKNCVCAALGLTAVEL